MLDSIVDLIRKSLSNSRKESLKVVFEKAGFDHRNWSRIVMYNECQTFLDKLDVENLEVLEISSGREWDLLPFKSLQTTSYPEFNICEDLLDKSFDVIIADQVFEHVTSPIQAGRNVLSMLRPGGWFIITTPFLIRIHNAPKDYWRWTTLGLRLFLVDCGFAEENITVFSWGNRACVKANLRTWPKKWPWRSLKNEPEFPVIVWAFAKK